MKITSCEISEKDKEILARMVRERGCEFIKTCTTTCPLYHYCPEHIDEISTGDTARHLLSIATVVEDE